MLLEAETNKYCPGGNDIGAISNLITWVLNFILSAESRKTKRVGSGKPLSLCQLTAWEGAYLNHSITAWSYLL
jgi:hypothetical protein